MGRVRMGRLGKRQVCNGPSLLKAEMLSYRCRELLRTDPPRNGVIAGVSTEIMIS